MAPRQLRLESVQHDSFLELIITGGILAIAGEITTNRTYTPKILSHGKKVRRKRRLHRLHQRDIICTGSLDHRTYFFRVGSKGFLAKNMLAIAHAKNTLGGMKEVRGGNIHGVDQRLFAISSKEVNVYGILCFEAKASAVS